MFASARYDTVLALLRAATATSKREAGEIALLAARASHALGDDVAWSNYANEAVRNLESGPSHAAALVQRASAARSLGKTREAKISLEDVGRELARLSAVSSSAARYDLARDAYLARDYAHAEALAKENLAAGLDEALNAELLGSVLVKTERFAEAATQFGAALRKLAASGETELALEARALAGLAFVAAETVDMRALERVRKASAKLPALEGLRAERFAILSNLWFASLLENDLGAAHFTAREAALVAPTPAARAIADVDAAITSNLLGDRNAYALLLDSAWATLRGGKWTDADTDVPLALLTFAAEAAATKPTEARRAMTLYRSLVPKGASAHPGDLRLHAIEAVAAGRVADAAGDDDLAERHYLRAFELFETLHCDMRAALVALDLRRITGDDDYVRRIKAVLSRAPDAWFGDQLAAQDGPVERLSHAELVVLAHLLRGETAKGIGERLDRSPFTISNHTRRIFAAFEVNSRSRVIAICAELGITPEYVERLAR